MNSTIVYKYYCKRKILYEKFLFLVLTFFLVLTACGSKEENKSKDETEPKSLN